MTDRLKDLRESRGKIVADLRAMLDMSEKEKRALTEEESAKYDAMFIEGDELRVRIGQEERLVEEERAVAAVNDAAAREASGGKPATTPEAELRMKGFRSWLMSGAAQGDGVAEFRALSAGTDTEGGFLVTPEQFVQQLLKAVDDEVVIRRRATVIPVPKAMSLGVPSLDADPADADWTTELQTGSEDSTMAFGKRALSPHPFAKRILISNDMLRQAMLPIEQIVISRMAYKFGITEDKGFLTGSGAQQPLGVFTASADGITTSRDVSTGNTSGSITFDGLIEAKYSVKGQYWQRASWLFHRDAMKQISKLKDGEGQYLWRASVREGEPDMVLGHPLDISENAPNTLTTGLYVGLFGDMSFYWIADAYDMQMQRLNELYAATNQVGFIGRQAVDGMPVLAEAFARVKLG